MYVMCYPLNLIALLYQRRLDLCLVGGEILNYYLVGCIDLRLYIYIDTLV